MSMEARLFRTVTLAVVLAASMGASYQTPNFKIIADDPALARQLGQAAEKYRCDLAVSWLGQTMPKWSAPCPITVRAGANLGAGGATTFYFDKGEVFGWRMSIQGSRERLLDSVLPHEITHMILATHFRRPLPRWADEGAATTVEHFSERAKHHEMLIEFLRSRRGIAFGRMFAMTEYPSDMLPLYAQGYTLAEFLVRKGGRRKFLEYLDEGMRTEQWSAATEKHYGIKDLPTLQNTWLAWIRQGCPRIERQTPASADPTGATQVASTGKLPRPEPNLILRVSHDDALAVGGDRLTPVRRSPAATDASQPHRSQAARPQSIQRPRQMVPQWSHQSTPGSTIRR